MEIRTTHDPSFLKFLQVIFFTTVIMYFGKTLFIPLFYGLLIAIIMYPACKWLEKMGWKRPLAITACLLVILVLFTALVALLAWQLRVFSDDVPALAARARPLLFQIQGWIKGNTGFDMDLQKDWNENISGSLAGILRSTFQATANTLFILFITPVYAALFLYHRGVFVRSIKYILPHKFRNQADGILQQTIYTYSRFVKGMFWVYLIVGILNSAGLLALGVDHAILFGMVCAIMTIIPYIGIIVSSLLPISVIWIQTGNIFYPLGVIAIFGFIQYLEAYVIFPKVVGAELNISTMAMLVAIIAGGIIWGVSGMILFIPGVAILKIVSAHVEEWKPLHLLLERK